MQAKRGAVFILAAVFIATILLLNYELIWSSKNNVYQSNANDTLLSPPSELLKLPNDLIHAFKDEPTMAFKDTEIIQDEPLVVINQENIPKANQTVIPKKIWSFWNDQPIPKFYTDCMERWKYFNPEYEIVMLTEASLASYSLKVPAIFYSIGPEWKADWIRLAILEMHGGIWIDASFIVAINMDWINDLVVHQNKDVFMFYSVPFTSIPEYPIYENWLIAAAKNAALISKWLQEFTLCLSVYEMKDTYLEYLQSITTYQGYLNLVQSNDAPGYLKQHIALQKVLQIDQMENPAGLASDDKNYGPFLILSQQGWDYWAYAKRLYSQPWIGPLPPLVKLRKFDRMIVLYYMGRRWDWIGWFWELIFLRERIHKQSVWYRYFFEIDDK